MKLRLALLGAALFLGAVLVPERRHRDLAMPDVVLVIGCTVRRDQTSLGSDLDTTPFLAELAAEGVELSAFISQAPWTRPSVAALVSGRFPELTGVIDPGPGRNDRVVRGDVELLSERLHRAGYRTLGVSTNPNVDVRYGFGQGFDAYVGMSTRWRDGMMKIDGSVAVQRALELVDWHDRVGGRPLYLQVVLVDAHQPDTSTPEERERFPAPSPRVSGYRVMLGDLDGKLRELSDGLTARGHGDAIFVFVGDHGEGLGLPTHHGNGHGRYLYPTTVHVPFVVRGPGLPAGHRPEGLAAGVDLVPTLLDLLGLSAEGHSGVSLADALRGGEHTGRRRVYTSTWFLDGEASGLYAEDMACYRRWRGRMPERLCHRWRDDPFATRPTSDAVLEAELVRWHEELGAAVSHDGLEAEVDPDLLDVFKTLGYLDE